MSIVLKSIYGEFFIGFYDEANKRDPMFDPWPYTAVVYEDEESAKTEANYLCSGGWHVEVVEEGVEEPEE